MIKMKTKHYLSHFQIILIILFVIKPINLEVLKFKTENTESKLFYNYYYIIKYNISLFN